MGVVSFGINYDFHVAHKHALVVCLLWVRSGKEFDGGLRLDWPEMASFLVFSEESVILLEHWISIYSSSKIG